MARDLWDTISKVTILKVLQQTGDFRTPRKQENAVLISEDVTPVCNLESIANLMNRATAANTKLSQIEIERLIPVAIVQALGHRWVAGGAVDLSTPRESGPKKRHLNLRLLSLKEFRQVVTVPPAYHQAAHGTLPGLLRSDLFPRRRDTGIALIIIRHFRLRRRINNDKASTR
jgi:hypothetical protein